MKNKRTVTVRAVVHHCDNRRVGVVVIGRNEGQRLIDCLQSLGDLRDHTVYVDSGSTDGSQGAAAAQGVHVVLLDPHVAFTAARARNLGLGYIIETWPDLEFVQFVDGDCRLDTSWIPVAENFLQARDDVALVFGRRRECHPERSVYNAMCDREWDGVAGEAMECGGDVFARIEVMRASGGYRERLIAGEEPELCVRLRRQGYRIWRLSHDMTLHDANIMHLSQWWRRTMRAGHAYAEVYLLHRKTPWVIWGRNLARSAFWSLLLPLSIGLSLALHPAALLLLLLYPIQILRLQRRETRWTPAFLLMLGKFAEMQGALRFFARRITNGRPALIEYK